MGFGDFLKGAAESVGKKIDDVAEGAGEVASDVGKTVSDIGGRARNVDFQNAAGMVVGEALKVPYRPGGNLAGDLEGASEALGKVSAGVNWLERGGQDKYTHDLGNMQWQYAGDEDRPASEHFLLDRDSSDDPNAQSLFDRQDYWKSDEGRQAAQVLSDQINATPEKYDLEAGSKISPLDVAQAELAAEAKGLGYESPNTKGGFGAGETPSGMIEGKADALKRFSTISEGASEAAETVIKEPTNPAAWSMAGDYAWHQVKEIPETLAAGAAIYGGIKGGRAVTSRFGTPLGQAPTNPLPGARGPLAPREPLTPLRAPEPGGMTRVEQAVKPRVGFKYKPEGWRQRGANRAGEAVEGLAERAGLPQGVGEVLGRRTTRTLEPRSVPPGARTGSRADANPGRFDQFGRDIWNTTRIGGLVQSAKTGQDVWNLSGNRAVQEAVDLYEPDKGVEALRDVKDWRSGDVTAGELADKYNLPQLGESGDFLEAVPDKYVYGAGALAAGGMVAGGLAAGGAAATARSLLRTGNPAQSVQQAAAQQTAGESQGYSPMYRQPQGTPSGSISPPRMESFGAGATTKPGKAARPAVVSGDYGYREPSVQHPLGSGMAGGSQGPSKSPLYAGISQPGPRMQPGEDGGRKRSQSFVSGSVHGEKGMTLSGTSAWNAQTKGSYVFPELTQPKKKSNEVLGV